MAQIPFKMPEDNQSRIEASRIRVINLQTINLYIKSLIFNSLKEMGLWINMLSVLISHPSLSKSPS